MIYLFDIDGTLTPPYSKMEDEFIYFFLGWARDKNIYLVAGSDKPKIDKQIPSGIQARCKGIFCCMANELWIDNEIIYQNDFNPSGQLKELLISYQMYGSRPVRIKKNGRGVIMEHRTGMLNFTTLGRNADSEERNRYYEWDKEHGERGKMAEEFEERFPELEVRLGGQISIDIQPRGHNKSQATKWLRENTEGYNRFVYFGDKCQEGGNDHDVYLDILKNRDGLTWQVENWRETMEVLSSMQE